MLYSQGRPFRYESGARVTSQSATTDIAAAVETLRAGGLVAYPTDTLYGLGADALNEAAVERVFEAKGRPQGMPLPLLISDAGQLPMVAASVPAVRPRAGGGLLARAG